MFELVDLDRVRAEVGQVPASRPSPPAGRAEVRSLDARRLEVERLRRLEGRGDD